MHNEGLTMFITLSVSREDLAMIRQGLMCAAATSRDHGHNKQAMEFHDCCNRLPDPFFPAKPELHFRKENLGRVTLRKGETDEYVCAACRVTHKTREDAEDCHHDEKERALIAIRLLKAEQPVNWQYQIVALEQHYINGK